jgi:hypothetical protein
VLMVQCQNSLHCRSMQVFGQSCFVRARLADLIGRRRGLLSLLVVGWIGLDSRAGQPVVSTRSLIGLKPMSQGHRPSVIVGYDTAAGFLRRLLLLLYLLLVAGR